MAIPSPDSLIAVVKPVPDSAETLISKLSAKMADPEVVVKAYRGSGLFSFYFPGYFTEVEMIPAVKELEKASYEVHAFKQNVGYMPADDIVDVASAGPGDPGVTGNSQFLWVQVSLSKKKVAY